MFIRQAEEKEDIQRRSSARSEHTPLPCTSTATPQRLGRALAPPRGRVIDNKHSTEIGEGLLHRYIQRERSHRRAEEEEEIGRGQVLVLSKPRAAE